MEYRLRHSYLWRWLHDAQTGVAVFITTAPGGITFGLAVACNALIMSEPVAWLPGSGWTVFLITIFSTVFTLVVIFIAQLLLAPARMEKAMLAEKEVAERDRQRCLEQIEGVRQRQNDRATLGRFLQEGNDLSGEIGVLLDISNDSEHLAEAEAEAFQKCEIWGNKVIAYLDEVHPGWKAVFLNESYSGTQFSAVNRLAKSRYRNWMQRRLAKLDELIRTLGPAA